MEEVQHKQRGRESVGAYVYAGALDKIYQSMKSAIPWSFLPKRLFLGKLSGALAN
jgi:hypothetical protein